VFSTFRTAERAFFSKKTLTGTAEKESPRAGEADFIVAKHRNGPTSTVTVAFQGHYSRFVDMAAG
jgi:replicative DNA helicase